jgi:hypothetical protein
MKPSKKAIYALIVFALGLIIYNSFVFIHGGSDIRNHVKYFLIDGYPGNFLYYFVIDMFSLFKRDSNLMLLTSTIILAVALVLKYLFYVNFFKFLESANSNESNLFKVDIFRLSFITLFVFSIPSLQFIAWGKYYSGQIVPNVWHNSTTMFLMPLAILILTQTFRIINSSVLNLRQSFLLVLLLLISITIKPSFAFAYIPTILFFVVFKKIDFKFTIVAVFGVLFIVIQYYVIYLKSSSLIYNTKSTIGFDFFGVWKSGLRNYAFLIFPAFLMSILFPLVHLILNFRRLIRNIYYQFILVFNVFAYFLYVFVSEKGPRYSHGNFYWQLVVATSFLFAYTIYDLYFKLNVTYFKNKYLNYISKYEYLVFYGHLVSGIFYILMIVIMGKYK